MQHATDAGYLAYQYGNAEKLQMRQEAHRLYSERQDSFLDWLVTQLAPGPDERIGDIGCGPGIYHKLVSERKSTIIAVDASAGMVAEARARATAHGLSVAALQADAMALPLADGCCSRVMANHMLYHVPDQRAALGELWRILGRSGRVVLATAAADSFRVLTDLHAQAAASAGYTTTPGMTARFTLDDINLVREVFPSARVHVREDAFLFPNSQAVLRYYASGLVDQITPLPTDGAHRRRLLPLMATAVDEIIATRGHLRVPKDAGCFVADI